MTVNKSRMSCDYTARDWFEFINRTLILNLELVLRCYDILVPRGRDPSGQHQGSRPLAGADFLSMRRVLALHFQPIRFARFDKESMHRGLPVLEPTRGLDPCC